MKKLLFSSIVLFSLLYITGCKKGSSDPTGPVYLVTKIKSVSSNSLDSNLYSYDSKNRLVDILVSSTNYDSKLIYDNSDLVTEVDQYLNGVLYNKNTYTYNNGVVTAQNVHYTNGVAGTPTNSTLNQNSDLYVTRLNGVSGYNTYTYDKSGNVTSTSFYQNSNTSTPASVTNYTYDNNKSAWLNVKGHYSAFTVNLTPSNNITAQTYTSSTQTQTMTFSYTYNSDGYPIKKVETTPGVTGVTQTYTYIIR